MNLRGRKFKTKEISFLIPILIPSFYFSHSSKFFRNEKSQRQGNRDDLLARVNKLTPNAKPLWGKMNSAQALRHMTMGVLTATGDTKIAPVKSRLPKFLMKIFLLKMKPPKERAETFKEMNLVKNGIMPTDFETERNNLKAAIEKVGTTPNYLPANPMGIKFNTSEWGQLAYNHTDHHLRQFGV